MVEIRLTGILIEKGFSTQVLHGMAASLGYDSVIARDSQVELLAPDGSTPTFAGAVYHMSQGDKYAALIVSGKGENKQRALYDCELIASGPKGKKKFKQTMSYVVPHDSILPSEKPSELELALQEHFQSKPVSSQATSQKIRVRILTE